MKKKLTTGSNDDQRCKGKMAPGSTGKRGYSSIILLGGGVGGWHASQKPYPFSDNAMQVKTYYNIKIYTC